MHSLSHCKQHFRRSGHESYGLHCGCCNKSFAWSDAISHLNQKGAHKRQSIVTQPPPPRTSTPDSSCTTASSPRYHPYRDTALTRQSPSTSRRPVAASRNGYDPYVTPAWSGSQAALGAPPTSPASTHINTGFGVPTAATEHTLRAHQLGVGYGLPPDTPSSPVSSSSQLPLLHIPSASFATHYTTQPQPVLPLSAYQSSIYSIDSSTRATSVLASPSLSSINTDDFLIPISPSAASLSCYLNDTSMATPTGTTGSGRSSVVTSVSVADTPPLQHPASVAVSPAATTTSTLPAYSAAPLTDRQLLQMAMGQLLWTYGIIATHVRHTDPDDVADSMGRHLLQSHGHWMLPIEGAMQMPLTELVRLLRPIWSHLYYSRWQ